MRSVYDRAKTECGYNATRFLAMLGKHGGVKTAKILLSSPDVFDEFVELYIHKRLDLTVEAQILSHPQFWELFDQEELDSARRWLKRHDWKGS